MKRQRQVLWLCGAACAAMLRVSAEDNAASAAADFRAAVSELVVLRAQAAKEARDWSRQREMLERELRLLQQAQAELLEQVSAARAAAEEEERGISEMAAKKLRLEQGLAALERVVEEAEQTLKSQIAAAPPWFVAELKFEAAAAPSGGRGGAAARTAALLERLARIEAAHGRIHYRRDILRGSDGAMREMDVLYLGLSRGFAVSDDNRLALAGAARAGGWTWTPADELAAEVRRAVDIHNRRRRAAAVALPLETAGEAQPQKEQEK